MKTNKIQRKEEIQIWKDMEGITGDRQEYLGMKL